MSVYDYTARDLSGRDVPLSDYRGRVLLVVNTATHCGFTPQYEGLMRLYSLYRARGFEILDFPCDQFGGQAPGTGEEVHAFCVNRYAIAFPQFDKVLVNGREAHPLFRYLKKELPGMAGGTVKWNFTKFLVDRQGRPVRRFSPNTEPSAIEEHIEALL